MKTLWSVDAEVAEELHGFLEARSTRGYVPPTVALLSEVLRVAANASLLEEEGRPTTFGLLLSEDVGSSDERFLGLETGLAYTPETVRRLAPALGGPFHFLIVKGTEPKNLTLTGVLPVQQPLDVSSRHIQRGLFVLARGPGHLSVGNDGQELLRVSPQGLAWLPRAVHADLVLMQVLDRALNYPNAGDLRSRESVVLLRLGRALLSHGHGGALFVCVGARDAKLTVKYRLAPPWEGIRSGLRDGRTDEDVPSTLLSRSDWELRAHMESRLSEAVTAVARLSAVDGAVLLDRDLSVCGFGTFVPIAEGDADQKVIESRVGRTGQLERVGELAASKTGGARHQSAVKFVCDSPGQRIAFVASHDGGLSLLFASDDQVAALIRPIGPAALTR